MAGAALSSVLLLIAARGAEPERTPPAPMPLEEARRTVRLMDDIYQTAVITTHGMYVRDPGTPAAVTWGKQVIRQVNAKGWPEARIFAATDRPLNPENNPADAFERDAAAAFAKGKTSLERVEGGTLRYATNIRITEKSCLLCHVKNKQGDLLGGVSYRAALKPAP